MEEENGIFYELERTKELYINPDYNSISKL